VSLDAALVAVVANAMAPLADKIERLTATVDALRAASPSQLVSVGRLVELGYGSPATIRRRIADGTIPCVRHGRSVRVDLASLRPTDPARVNAHPLPAKDVAHVFNTVIWGDVSNLAVGSENFTQASQVAVQKDDFASLRDFLEKLGVTSEEVAELESSIKDDAKDSGPGKLGPKTSNWFGRAMQKAAAGALNIGTSVAATVLGKALAKYLGLP
jgi:hypothetical protein